MRRYIEQIRKLIFLIIMFSCALSLNAEVPSTDWFYNTLNDKEQILYNEIEDAVYNCETEVSTILPRSDALRIFEGFLDDNPGVFWVDRLKTTYKPTLIADELAGIICMSYTHQESLEEDKQEFIRVVSRFSDYIKDDPNDWIKLYHIYDYLGSTIEYSLDYLDQSMWSVFFRGIGVCAGFARSFQYLALLQGIPSVVVHGWSKDQNGNKGTAHLWVMAEINGKWYHFDPTWGLLDNFGDVDFSYFCRSEERISKTHIINKAYPIPESYDDTMSYAARRHRMFSIYDRRDFMLVMADAFEHGEYSFTVEYETEAELKKAVTDLIEDQTVWKLLSDLNASGLRKLKYVTDNNSNSLKLVFSKR